MPIITMLAGNNEDAEDLSVNLCVFDICDSMLPQRMYRIHLFAFRNGIFLGRVVPAVSPFLVLIVVGVDEMA